jgi:vesicle-fusing ATPase
MTNRVDLLDEALLRPGRIEVLVEVGLPDEAGRLQILDIHTKSMAQAKILDAEVDIHRLAKLTKNFTGSELEGVVRAASSFALQRTVRLPWRWI